MRTQQNNDWIIHLSHEMIEVTEGPQFGWTETGEPWSVPGDDYRRFIPGLPIYTFRHTAHGITREYVPTTRDAAEQMIAAIYNGTAPTDPADCNTLGLALIATRNAA